MRARATSFFAAALLAAAPLARGQEDLIDQLDDHLTFSALGDALHVRVSGTLDLEGYYTSIPEPGLFETDDHAFFNPRLSLFMDAQLGSCLYAFAQMRADNGFDPGDPGPRVRLDEYVLRLVPFDNRRFNIQVGKFATVVGNWTQRHGSWENPFITAPLPYENLTGVWDTTAAHAVPEVQFWGGILPHPSFSGQFIDQYRNIPIIWGPSYASGAAVLGQVGQIDYAFEVKNTSLSSRPESWAPTETQWQNPTFSGRVAYTPNEMWNFGVSASAGPYLMPEAIETVSPGVNLDRYLELVVGEDMTFAWHHIQVWAEAYEARFEIPGVGNADTLAYYVEAKYKFTPQFFGALRWNQQVYAPLPVSPGADGSWSRAMTRIDIGPCYRLTPHAEVKVQYAVEHQVADTREWSDLVAVQLTVRF